MIIEVTKGHGNHRIITTSQLKRVMAVIEAAQELVEHDAEKDFTTEQQWISLSDALANLVPNRQKP